MKPATGKKPVILQVVAAMDQGGVEQGTLDMADYIARRGWHSLVASQGGRRVTELEKAGAQHFYLPLGKRNPLAIIYNALRLVGIIRKHQVSLLHTRSRAPAWATLIASRITGIPFITSFHGTHRIQNRFKRYYNRVMTSGLLTIANSRFIRQHIMDNYQLAQDRLRLAQRGIDTDVFNPEAVSIQQRENLRAQWALNDSPVLLMPGRLTRWKGQAVFIQALALLTELPWQAVIIGGADKNKRYIAELAALVMQHGLDKRILFTGSQDRLAPWYALADITVSASTEPEAFGRIAIESQAMGTPVIATAHGGALETVKPGETGWLVPPGNAAALSAALREALRDRARLDDMGRNARHWIHENFTVQTMCAQEFSVYEELLENQ